MDILIADDDNFTRGMLKAILEAENGWKVNDFENGQLAWDYLSSGFSANICIVDVRMPVLDGMGLLRRLRQDSRFSRLPVLMITALRDKDVVSEASKLGIQGFVLKPYNANEVIDIIKKVARRGGAVDDPWEVMKRLHLKPKQYLEQLDRLIEEVEQGIVAVRNALLRGSHQDATNRLDALRGACTIIGASQFASALNEMLKFNDHSYLISNYHVLEGGLQGLKNARERVRASVTEEMDRAGDDGFELKGALLESPLDVMKKRGIGLKQYRDLVAHSIQEITKIYQDAQETIQRGHAKSTKMILDGMSDLCDGIGATQLKGIAQQLLQSDDQIVLERFNLLDSHIKRLQDEWHLVSKQFES